MADGTTIVGLAFGASATTGYIATLPEPGANLLTLAALVTLFTLGARVRRLDQGGC